MLRKQETQIEDDGDASLFIFLKMNEAVQECAVKFKGHQRIWELSEKLFDETANIQGATGIVHTLPTIHTFLKEMHKLFQCLNNHLVPLILVVM